MYCRNCGAELVGDNHVCWRCGVEIGKGSCFCAGCGAATSYDATHCPNCGLEIKRPQFVGFGVKRREIVWAIILSLITCGFYSIYWFVCLTDDMNKVTGRVNDTSGGVALLFTLITCGIYSYYWSYKIGEKRDTLDPQSNNSGILYLILAILGWGIIVYALAQDAINKSVSGNY